MPGRLEAIFISPKAAAPMRGVGEALAVAGRGLEGDRYFERQGTWWKIDKPDREITLIEAEALEAFSRESGILLATAESRRNLLTRGVALNPLVGKTFRVGGVELEGIKLCEPCAHLEKLTKKKVASGLAGRGGLRARVVKGGAIRVGDEVA